MRNIVIAAVASILAWGAPALGAEARETKGHWYFEPSAFIGFGFKGKTVGKTTKGDSIKLSGGGGLGGALAVGYGLSDRVDGSLALGLQSSSLTPRVSNGKGSYDRNFLLATVKYRVPFGDGAFKFGAGVGSYQSGKLKLDLTGMGGNNEEVGYKNAMGLHETWEYEGAFNNGKWAFLLGVRLVQVSYKAKSYKVNGVSVPPQFLVDDVRTLDGGGLDLIVGLKF